MSETPDSGTLEIVWKIPDPSGQIPDELKESYYKFMKRELDAWIWEEKGIMRKRMNKLFHKALHEFIDMLVQINKLREEIKNGEQK